MVEITRDHMDFVYRVRWKLFPPFDRLTDDFISAGMFGLFEAAKSYDAAGGASFKTHAYHRIHGAMQDCAREGVVRSTGAIMQPLVLGGEVVEYVADKRGGYDSIGGFELNDSLQSAIDMLPSGRQQLVIRLYYLQDWDMGAIGDLLGISSSAVSQLASRACTQLSKILNREALAA